MSDVERELRAELLRVNSTGDCLEKENAGLRATIAKLRAEIEHWKRGRAATEEAAKKAEAKLAEDTRTIRELIADIESFRAEVERLRDLLRAPAREVIETQRARADRAEADLAEAVGALRKCRQTIVDHRDLDDCPHCVSTIKCAAALLAKVKP